MAQKAERIKLSPVCCKKNLLFFLLLFAQIPLYMTQHKIKSYLIKIINKNTGVHSLYSIEYWTTQIDCNTVGVNTYKRSLLFDRVLTETNCIQTVGGNSSIIKNMTHD